MITQTVTCDYCRSVVVAGAVETNVTAPPDGFSFRGLRAHFHFCDRSCLSAHLLKMGRELMVGNARLPPPDPSTQMPGDPSCTNCYGRGLVGGPGGGKDCSCMVHLAAGHSSSPAEHTYEALIEYELAQFGLASRGADRRVVVAMAALLDRVYRETIEACATRLDARGEELRDFANDAESHSTRMHIIEQAVEMSAAATLLRRSSGQFTSVATEPNAKPE